MQFSRRHFVAATAASWLCAGLPQARAQRQQSVAQQGIGGRPRYFVTFFLRGGIDPVYTVDPKVRADVDAKVDVPYGANTIVDAGGVPFGPHFEKLKPWASKLAVLRGVQVKTANHETGAFQTMRMRTGVTTNMPSLHDVLGTTRDGQPLASVVLGDLTSFEHSPGSLAAPTAVGNTGTTSLDAVDALTDEELALLARSYQQHLTRFPKWQQSPEALRTREHVSQAAAFFDKLKTTKRFKADTWDARKGSRALRVAEDLQRTLWLLENDLTRGVAVRVVFDWDSHYRNADKQAASTGDFVPLLARFLDGLHTRRNQHGVLADQTALVVGSELGRFPVINGNLGKDHFPEAPYIFCGPAFNTGKAFIPTGKMMEALPVSLATGNAGEASADHVVLDDVGSTLLHMAGVDPLTYGYRGRRLRFLERAS